VRSTLTSVGRAHFVRTKLVRAKRGRRPNQVRPRSEPKGFFVSLRSTLTLWASRFLVSRVSRVSWLRVSWLRVSLRSTLASSVRRTLASLGPYGDRDSLRDIRGVRTGVWSPVAPSVLSGPGTVKPVALFITVGPTYSMLFRNNQAALYNSLWSIWLSDTVRTGSSKARRRIRPATRYTPKRQMVDARFTNGATSSGGAKKLVVDQSRQ
jgi:hypothetical protein